MPDILHELMIEGKPDAIYKAITEQAGLAGWWTVHATAQPKVGAVDEFGFQGGQVVMKMEVAKLEPGKAVQWKVLQGAPDWGGTQVTWDLTPGDAGTKVLFGHRNYASTEGSFASVSYPWAWFLTSLKAYIETGKGTPNTL